MPVGRRRCTEISFFLEKARQCRQAKGRTDCRSLARPRAKNCPTRSCAHDLTRTLTKGESGDEGGETRAWPTGQLVVFNHAPRNRFAICRTSSLSILYFSVLRGIPRYSPVPVTFQAFFSSARRMKFRSNVLVASSKRLSVRAPCGSS